MQSSTPGLPGGGSLAGRRARVDWPKVGQPTDRLRELKRENRDATPKTCRRSANEGGFL